MRAPPQRTQLIWPAKIAADLTALRRDNSKTISGGGTIRSNVLRWRGEQEYVTVVRGNPSSHRCC